MSLALALIASAALTAEHTEGRLAHSVMLAPSVQVNGKFTEHYGTTFNYALGSEHWAATLTVQNNWVRRQHGFNRELMVKTRQVAQATTTVLMPWAVLAGFRLVPLKGSVGENGLDFEGVVDVGAGYGARSLLLAPQSPFELEASLGGRPTGSGALGLGVRFADGLWLRAELRSLFGSSSVESVNGCSFESLDAIERTLRTGGSLMNTMVNQGCRVDSFTSPLHVPLAMGAMRGEFSDTLFILSANLGLSASF